MTSFEKTVVVIASTVAIVLLIICVVLCSVTAVQVYSLQPQRNQQQPHIYRDRHGNLEIEIPEEGVDNGPPIPKYRNPLGNKGEVK